MATVRLLDQNRTLLGILEVSQWSYVRKISEATEISVTCPLKQTHLADSSELFTFLSPVQSVELDSDDQNPPEYSKELAYFLEIWKDSRLITGIISKRDFTDTNVTLKAHTEENLLTRYLSPSQYGRKYENWDIQDIANDMSRAWLVQRVKAKSQWDAGILSNVDTATEPGKVLLSKSGAYNASGSITLTFNKPTNWAVWERIRWSGDYDSTVATKMQYSTDGGSTWSPEYIGGEPDTLGIEIADTSADSVMVKITLTTTDTTSQDNAGNPVGVTPRLFAVDVISRTAPYFTVSSIDGLTCKGLEVSNATPLAILQAACEQVGKEFYVDNGQLFVGTMGDDRHNEIFLRKSTNMVVTQLGDELAEVYNVIHATGSGSGINRLEITRADTTSIATYGVREKFEEFDTEDLAELTALADAFLAEHKEPFYAWKVKALYPPDDEPLFGCGDWVTVSDKNIVTQARIEQLERQSTGGVSLYLNKTRADLVQRSKPTYADLAVFDRPVAISVYPTIKGLIASVSRPVDITRWDYTELHLSTTVDFTPSADTLYSERRATMFEVNDLAVGMRYYLKAIHVATDGTKSEPSDERSGVPLAVTATDIEVQAGWGLTENSPSTGQILIFGTDIEGEATTENGFVQSGSGVLVVNYQTVTPIDEKINFLVLESGVVTPVYYNVNDNKFLDGSDTEVITGVIIGTVTKSTSVTSSQCYTRAISLDQGKADQVQTAMRYLSQATDSESFDAIAKGLGIENAFYTLAVYNGFITNLYAQNLNIQSTGSERTFLSFDGVDDTCVVPDNNALDFGDTDFTIEAWVYNRTQEVNRGIVTKTDAFDDTNINYGLDQVYDGWSFKIKNTDANVVATSSQYDTNKWVHLAGVYKSGGTIELYVNGNLEATKTGVAAPTPNTGSLYIGSYFTGKYFDGNIRDVRIWNTARTASQIADNMSKILVGDEAGLVALYKLDEGTGATATDAVSANNGAISGAVWDSFIPEGFSIRAISSENGDGVFEILSNTKRLFRVDGLSGNIFFGNNFWYDPATGSIRTPNDKTVIKADGTIEAVDGNFTGVINATSGYFTGSVFANSGYFKGIFDTTALKLEPGTLNSYVNTASSAITQIKNLVIYALNTLGLSNNALYRASVPSGTYQTNSGSTLSGDNVKYISYRSQYIGYGDYSYTVYFYDISKTLMLSVQYNDVTGGGKYYFTSTISITTYTGGDKLIVSSDIPTELTGLSNYQIYLSGDTLKVKLP